MNSNDKWNGCKFFYFRDVFLPKSNAHVTIAFRVLESGSENIVYECQAAFSSPRERFSKKLGRNIACGRLNKTPLRRVIENDHEVGLFRNVIKDVQENALAELVELHNPAWWDSLKREKRKALNYFREISLTTNNDKKAWDSLVESNFKELENPWEK